MDPLAEIKKLYYSATKATIQKDLARAIDLLKALPNEDDREKVAVYMDGLAQMRSEWSASPRPKGGELRREPSPSGSRPQPSAPRRAAPPARSDQSRSSSRRMR